MNRLSAALIGLLVKEIVLLALVLWVLPEVGFNLPLWATIGSMIAVVAWTVMVYRLSGRTLKQGPFPGLVSMIGSKGKVVGLLAPEGTIRIGSELWKAVATDEKLKPGEEVIVVGQNGLSLAVRKIAEREATSRSV